MTTLKNVSRGSLLEELKDKETRELFVEEHIGAGLHFQIHGLREKLGLTQKELARRAGMAQERISVLEDPNYEFLPKIKTLVKLANVFDVPLIVKFGSWKEVFRWDTELSPELLAPQTFEEEVIELERFASTGYYQPATITSIVNPEFGILQALSYGPESVNWKERKFSVWSIGYVSSFQSPLRTTEMPLIDYVETGIAHGPGTFTEVDHILPGFFMKGQNTNTPIIESDGVN